MTPDPTPDHEEGSIGTSRYLEAREVDALVEQVRRPGGALVSTHKCIGFGPHDGRCTNPSGPNPIWCVRCDKLRMAHLDKQFAKISAAFKERT